MGAACKVVVAGAGALGLSAALALADAGCAVTVCDPEEWPRASGVAAGMLAPVFEAALEPEGGAALDLLLAARNDWPRLEARAGVRLDRAGALAVGEDAWLGQIAARLGQIGVRATEIGRPTIDGLAPGLAPNLGRGLLMREDWRLEPRAALTALRGAAEAAGVAFRKERVVRRGDEDMLVVATGIDRGLADIAPELVRLSPIKGQILRFAGEPGAALCIRGEGVYAAPGFDCLAIGATMEAGREDLTPDPTPLAPITAAAARLFPDLAGATFAVSVGVRAATPDGLPMAGFSAAPGVVLATGARRNGWLLAPLVAGVVRACVTDRDPGPFAARLDPRRFTA